MLNCQNNGVQREGVKTSVDMKVYIYVTDIHVLNILKIGGIMTTELCQILNTCDILDVLSSADTYISKILNFLNNLYTREHKCMCR